MNYMHDDQFANQSRFSPEHVQNDFDGFDAADTSVPLQNWASSHASLAVWRRELPVEISKAMPCLPIANLKSWSVTCDVEDVATCVDGALASWRIADANLEKFLATDMTLLAQVFASNANQKRLDIRLDVIKDNACRKYHVDNYPERLAVTYLGPGTVAVSPRHAKRALDEQEDYSGPEFEILPFWVSVFSGTRSDRKGLVHRSPRIAGTGHTRLFFCVNAASPS